MLVLTRKPGERITCEVQPSDKVTTFEVVLVRMELDQVRLGFEANKDEVNIRRNEVAEEPYLPVIEKPQRAASPDDDCDVDLSMNPSPLKRLGTAVFEARTDIKKKNSDYED